MITLKSIDQTNFKQVLDMKAGDGGVFVAPNIYSLAEAWLYYEVARPFAIYDDERPVGFLMLHWDEPKRVLGVWRLMLNKDEQLKGYGQEALRLVIEMARSSGKFDHIDISFMPDNHVGEHVYRKLGFMPTGEMDGEEVVLRLRLG